MSSKLYGLGILCICVFIQVKTSVTHHIYFGVAKTSEKTFLYDRKNQGLCGPNSFENDLHWGLDYARKELAYENQMCVSHKCFSIYT